MAVTNIFLKYTENIPEVHKQVYSRLKDPLVTLMATSSSEISYACLSHIKFILVYQYILILDNVSYTYGAFCKSKSKVELYILFQ